jgi:response regulator RpfG family c-di-GMP phosphodiesterase
MKRSKILIADDAQINRDMLTVMLGDKYDFVYACDGVEVIEMLDAGENADLMLLDLNMPNMGGFDVLHTMNVRKWINDIPVMIISAEDNPELIAKAFSLGVVDYISRPFYTVIVQRRVENTLLMYSKQKQLVHMVENQVYEREKISNSMINIFSDIIETRNHESGSHTLNVQAITSMLLTELSQRTDKYRLTKSDISLITTLSALHDIGKIKVPENILNKPGKLTADEWEIMKAHTVEGDKILASTELDQNSNFIKTARSICRWHHEKYDGKGYPDGLVGDEIPIAAQVVSLADVYDALTSERCYKKAFSHEKAVEMISSGECGAFNPLLIEAFNAVSDSLESLKESGNHYDFSANAALVADEALKANNLPYESHLQGLIELEHLKKNFFMECCGGIKFEYNTSLRRATFIGQQTDGTSVKKTFFSDSESEHSILPKKYWKIIHDKLSEGGRENPYFEEDIELKLDGERPPYHARVMALWPETGDDYIYAVGQFTPIEKD